MDAKIIFITLLCAMALFGGFAYSYFAPTENLFPQMPFPLVAVIFFISGVVFFGLLSFIPVLLFGMQLGAGKNAVIFLYLIPSLFSIFAGTKLGILLLDDFRSKKTFLKEGRKILILFVVAIALSFAVELALPYIVEFWPKDFLGLNISEGESFVNMLFKMSNLIKK